MMKNMTSFLFRLCAYIPIIWQDRDYDFEFVEDLLIFKLKRMANFIEKNGLAISKHRTVKQIRYAVYLLERLKKQEDMARLYKAHEAKWGKPTWMIEDKFTVIYPKATTPELQEVANEERGQLYSLTFMKENELYDRFWRHMKKYWRFWWD